MTFGKGKKKCVGLVRQGFEAKKCCGEPREDARIYLSKPEGHGLAYRGGLSLP